jgi:hypothetical protein
MLAKIVIVVFLLTILYTLGSSFYFMVKDKGEGDRTLKRLMWRIGLSLFLLALLYAMFLMGWIEGSGGPINLKGAT